VDDDPAITMTFENILRCEGYEVATATDGPDAVRVARYRPFDLILLDLVMPRMDGLAALRDLREVAPQARVVILSAYIEPEREAEAFRLGAVAVLAKPPDLQKLLEFLHELTEPPAG
jgi:CheY-like chemotaxis protein